MSTGTVLVCVGGPYDGRDLGNLNAGDGLMAITLPAPDAPDGLAHTRHLYRRSTVTIPLAPPYTNNIGQLVVDVADWDVLLWDEEPVTEVSAVVQERLATIPPTHVRIAQLYPL